MTTYLLNISKTIRDLSDEWVEENCSERTLHPNYGQPDTLFSKEDRLWLSECDDGRWYVGSVHNDPINPLSIDDVVENLKNLISEKQMGSDKLSIIKPKCFYGSYADNFSDAVELMKKLDLIPAALWPKEYNPPRET